MVDAIDQLQNGDEPAARQSVEQALALDPANDLARNLRDQIEADAQKELGGVFFRYTVQRDDSLSKLAQQYLGDRYKFYILAKYNDIANPGRLGAGQIIKIPGKQPIAPPAAAARPARPDAAPEPTARTPEPEPPASPPDAKAIVARSLQLQKNGDLEGAYAAANDATRRDPGNREAAAQREAVKLALVRRYEREAASAFQRQNLDVAIARWTSVLDLDPGNQKARLERERANDLKKRITEKFGK
ncbi:MAG: LysM domain-containing protein [Casimicrobiaceae bacterium]